LVHLFNYYSYRIVFITYELELSRLLSEERRAALKKELSSLIQKRDNLIKVIEKTERTKTK